MHQNIHTRSNLQIILAACILIGTLAMACRNAQKESENPDPTAYRPPITKSFELTEPKQIEWEVTDPDRIAPPESYPLDIDQLPSKPFTISEFKPLKSPMKEYPLDWKNMPEVTLRYDTLDIKSFASILPKPIIANIEKPGIFQGSTAGLLQLAQPEGLPSGGIVSIIENEDGTFWISTTMGASLYNGEFLYTYEYENIHDVVKDHKERLWIGTERGFYILDFKSNIQWYYPMSSPSYDLYCDHLGTMWVITRRKVYFLTSDLKYIGVVSNQELTRPTKFMEDRNHNLWLGFNRYILVIDKERKGYKRIDENEQWQIGLPMTFYEDQNGYVWVGRSRSIQNGAISFSVEDSKARVLGIENGFLGDARIVQEDSKGQIWLMQNGSFSVLNEDHSQIKTIPIKGDLFSNDSYTIRDKRGNIWLTTEPNGIILISRDGVISEHLDELSGLTSSEIWDIKEGSRGDIWLAIASGGLDIYDPKKGEIRSLSHQILKNREGRRVLFTKEFEQDRYFVEGQNGFLIIDRVKNIIFFYDTDRIYDAMFTDLLVDELNNFWLPNRRGLMVYNTELKQIKSIMDNSAQFPGTRAFEIIDDGSGHFWIATDEGLMIINPKENTIQYLTEKEGLCNNRVMRMMQREDGELWIVTIDGLSIINTEEQTITNIGEEQGLIPDELYEIQEKEGTIYLGSVNGLIIMKPLPGKNNEWSFYNLNAAQGFPANDYLRGGSHVMSNGQLWMGSGNPSYILNILTQDPSIDTIPCPVTINSLKISDEYQFFASRADLQSFFRTNDTLWYDDGKQFYLEQTIPQDSGYLFTNNIRWDSLSLPYKMPVGLKLPYNQNSLQFRFSNQCVFNRDKIFYRYQLEGKEDAWVYSNDVSTSKTYFNLAAGRYTFRVATKGITGKWGVPAEFSFRIIPPWWRTWWAYLGYALLAIGGVWAIVQYRSRRLQRENRLLEEKVSYRTKKLRESIKSLKETQAQLIHSEKMASLGELTAGIAHEIQNPLNFVNNFSEVSNELIDEMNEELDNGDLDEAKAISTDIKQNLEKILHHGKRADGIVKGMLQHSRSNSGEKEPTDINALADEYLRLAYHGLRAKDKSFNATLDTDFDESIGKVNIIPQDIGRVILNLITNAFYACNERKKAIEDADYKPTVSVSTKKTSPFQGPDSYREEGVQITVSDNGSGIPDDIKQKIFQPFFTTKATGEGTGLGLSLSYDIVKAHEGELSCSSQVDEGTKFIIKLPVV